MDPLTMGLIGGGVSLLGGLFQGFFNQNSADKQMKFQERMSDTSYQRGVKDMEAAGINPMLAYQQGGASSPSGASATIGNVGSDAVEGFGSGVNSARTMDTMAPQIANMNSDTELKKAQVGSAKAAALASLSSASLNSANAATVNAVRPFVAGKATADMVISQANQHVAGANAATADNKQIYANSPVGKALQMIGYGGSDLSSAFSAAQSGLGVGAMAAAAF